MRKKPEILGDLKKIREWADSKISSESEPPWAWYQYMKLRETLDAILGGMEAVSPTANLQQSATRQGAGLRLVDSKRRPDSAQRRPSGTPVPLPT